MARGASLALRCAAGQSRRVKLDARGDPIHTRTLGVGLSWRADGRLDLNGQLLDLRKRGCVPIVGALQGSGLIHHMRVRGVIDAAARRLDEIASEQPTVVFEPAARTRGESCRDPASRVAELAGATLDAGFARRVGAGIGGPRGCTHVLSLVQLAGGTVPWALDVELERAGALRPRAAGSRLFQRGLVVDGFETGRFGLLVAVQQHDLHLAEPPPVGPPYERLAAQRSVHLRAEIDCTRMELRDIRASERVRAGVDRPGEWETRDAAVAGLAGLSLRPGVATELLRRLGGDPARRPLLDALLQLTPAVLQCLAALEGAWQAASRQARGDPEAGTGVGSFPDSCYMWRRGGALDALRAEPPERSGPKEG